MSSKYNIFSHRLYAEKGGRDNGIMIKVINDNPAYELMIHFRTKHLYNVFAEYCITLVSTVHIKSHIICIFE